MGKEWASFGLNYLQSALICVKKLLEEKSMSINGSEQLTKEDVKRIEAEIEHRKMVVRPQALKALKEARALGDLSENFEYYCAKRDNNQNNSRIRYLEKMLRFATIVDEADDEDTIGINNTVEVYFEDDDYTESYRIVTPIRCDPLHGIISNESPLGAALMGKKIGERVVVNVDGASEYAVVIKSISKTGESEDDKMHSY